MVKEVLVSKVLAITTVVMTASALAGIITMVIVYQQEIVVNPPIRPTRPNATDPLPTGPPPDLRLPGYVVPQSYDLYLRPLLYTQTTNTTNQTLAFEGNSTVSLFCLNRTQSIFLHSSDLNLTLVTVKNADSGDDIPVSGFTLYADDSDFLEVELKEVLEVGGNYILFTAFRGEMEDSMQGLYVSKYKQERGRDTVDNERLLATTQMQPTDARKVFPCFDEPALKAEFTVTIIHRDGTTALANGVSKGSTSMVIDGENWVVTRFWPVKKMSTYLLAFSVSNFKSIKSPSSADERVEISIHARPEAIDAGHADYAARITRDLLTFYEGYFDIDYPFQKLDQLAVPDLMGGAMENWGLIIYRESTLLYEEGVSSIFNKDVITGVVAHELAHQWFGNLVTMKWWNNLWLNEGFATYLAYLGVDHVHPDWNIRDFMVLNEFQIVFEVDSLTSSHPLIREEKDIQSPNDISEMFNGITYSKGAAVIRMLADYISERVFKIGLRKYLKALQYNNADEQDLWKYLQQAVDEDKGYIQVSEVMYTWTKQMGYPLITINTTNGELFQQHFLLNDSASGYDLAWSVPIRVMKSGAEPTLELFTGIGPETRPSFRAEKNQWVLANVNCTGYYRVNYNPENWERLLHQLETNFHVIPRLSRAQIIDDAFNLARAHHVNVTLALRSTRYLRNETDFIPWEAAFRNLDYFILMFDRSEVYGPMQAYLRKQVSGLYEHFENLTLTSSVPDSYSELNNQLNAIEVACNNRLTACQSMVQALFREWMANHTYNPIHVNLRFNVYCLALAEGGEEEWEFAWGMYQNATLVSEKNNLHYALSCTSHIWLLNRYLEYTLDPTKIRKMDAVSTINDVAKNVAGQALAWDFVRAHWTYLMEEYGVGIMSFDNLIDGVTERFSTAFELQQLRLFQSAQGEKGLGPAGRAVEQAIERTQANMQWVRENKRTVLEWLRAEVRNP